MYFLADKLQCLSVLIDTGKLAEATEYDGFQSGLGYLIAALGSELRFINEHMSDYPEIVHPSNYRCWKKNGVSIHVGEPSKS